MRNRRRYTLSSADKKFGRVLVRLALVGLLVYHIATKQFAMALGDIFFLWASFVITPNY